MKLDRVFRTVLTALLLLALGTPLLCCAGAEAFYEGYDYADLQNLVGAMEVVNCTSYASLRAYPNTSSERLARVPLGAVVTNCWGWDNRFTFCSYDGIDGYILTQNLSFINGPIGYEFPDSDYLGNMEIVNCTSYASLRMYPDTSSTRLAQVPLGSIVTNVYYYNDKFSWCMYGDIEGYILNSNLYSVLEAVESYSSWGTCMIVNCQSWASLRELPDTASARLAKIPAGELVTDCVPVSDKFARCTWQGITGYVLISNLGQMFG